MPSEKHFSPRGKLVYLEWTEISLSSPFIFCCFCILHFGQPLHLYLWACFIRNASLFLFFFFTFCDHYIRYYSTGIPMNETRCADMTSVCLEQSCRATWSHLYCLVFTSSVFLSRVSLLSHSWSKYVWELRCPAVQSSDLEVGPALHPTLPGISQSQPGVRRCRLPILWRPTEA